MSTAEITPRPPSLVFWVTPGCGTPYEIDLTEFLLGGRRETVRIQNRRGWAGDFSGRPNLATEFARYIHLEKPIHVTARHHCHGLRQFFRFLDDIDPRRQIQSSCDVTDGHGGLLLTWIERPGRQHADRTLYTNIKSLVAALRSYAGLTPLFWPARGPDLPKVARDVDEPGVRRLFEAFKVEARQIKAMFCEGSRLAESGNDPRGEFGNPGSAAWEQRENHAWLVSHLTQSHLLTKREFIDSGASGLNKSNNPKLQKHMGPEYLAPLMTVRGQQGFVGKLRWFHPSNHDTAVFLWLFLIGTGWNLATALALDVTEDATWVDPHPQKPGTMVLHSFKNRADRHQFAISTATAEWYPYQIVRFMVERTGALRRTLELRAAELRTEVAHSPSPTLQAEIVELEAGMRSPWLYHVVNEVGRVGHFQPEDAGHLNEILRAVVERHGLAQEYPGLLECTTSDMRDAWIGHAYDQSGYNVLIARLAAQHSNLRTLRHYLNRRRYRSHSEQQVRKLQDAAYAEIQARRPLDPTRLRILLQQGHITEEQGLRLADYRARTRLGMGCLDPYHPPAAIDPAHPEGGLCRVQRCLGCRHGVVFDDSLEPLARAYAGLIFIKRKIGFAAWTGSSLEEEENALYQALSGFNQDRVKSAVDTWLERFRRGDAVVHDVFPTH